MKTPTKQIMSSDQARECVADIKVNVQTAKDKFKLFHDREGWRALGYQSFKECCQIEFQMARSTAYNLLEDPTVKAQKTSKSLAIPSTVSKNLDTTSKNPNEIVSKNPTTSVVEPVTSPSVDVPKPKDTPKIVTSSNLEQTISSLKPSQRKPYFPYSSDAPIPSPTTSLPKPPSDDESSYLPWAKYSLALLRQAYATLPKPSSDTLKFTSSLINNLKSKAHLPIPDDFM